MFAENGRVQADTGGSSLSSIWYVPVWGVAMYVFMQFAGPIMWYLKLIWPPLGSKYPGGGSQVNLWEGSRLESCPFLKEHLQPPPSYNFKGSK